MPKPKVLAARALHPIEKLDLVVGRAVALKPKTPQGKVAGAVATLGDQPPLIMLAGATVAAGLLRRDERLARSGLRMLGAHSLSIIGKLLVKNLVDRTRPNAAIEQRKYRLEPGGSRDGRFRSMPSGHSAGTVAVAIAAATDHPAARAPIAAAATAIVASQLPSRNHFLSDVVVGSVIGLIAGLAARALIPPFDPDDRQA